MEQIEIPGTEPASEQTYTIVCQEVWHREVSVIARSKREALLRAVDTKHTVRAGNAHFERDLRPDKWKVTDES